MKGGVIKLHDFRFLFFSALLAIVVDICKGQSGIAPAPEQVQIDFRIDFGEIGSYYSPRACRDIVVYDDNIVAYYSDKIDGYAVYNILKGTLDSISVRGSHLIDPKLCKPFAYLPPEVWTEQLIDAWTNGSSIRYPNHKSGLLLVTSEKSLTLIDFDLHSVLWSNPFNPLGLYRLHTEPSTSNFLSGCQDTIVWVLHNFVFYLQFSTGLVTDSFTLDPNHYRDSWSDSYYGTFANAIFPKNHGEIPVFIGGLHRYDVDRLCVYDLDNKKRVWMTESPHLVHDWNDSLLVYVDTFGSLICRNFLRGTEFWKVTAADKISQLCMKSDLIYFCGTTFGCVRVNDGVTIWTDSLTGYHSILSTGSKNYIGLLSHDPNSSFTTGITLYRHK